MTEPESSLPQPIPESEGLESALSVQLGQPADAPPPAAPPPDLPRIVRRARQIPNLAHTLLLLVIAAGTLFITEIAAFGLVLGMHLFGREDPQLLLRDPRLLIPSMALSYLIAGALAWAIFTNLWHQPFARAIRWNSSVVERRFYVFLGLGILLSVAVQLLSNYLPIPKTLPIDNFFRTPTDIWIVAIFGTLVAPIFEELAFRGFLFPSLASAWDWLAQHPGPGPALAGIARSGSYRVSERDPSDPSSDGGDPDWSANALVFSSIVTSIGFALLHADQLAHSWAPLLVLFSVSIVLCLVRLRAHSLAASTLVHAAYNGAIFALIFFATNGFRHLGKLNQ